MAAWRERWKYTRIERPKEVEEALRRKAKADSRKKKRTEPVPEESGRYSMTPEQLRRYVLGDTQ